MEFIYQIYGNYQNIPNNVLEMGPVWAGPFRILLGCLVLTGLCSVKSEYASAVAVSREWWMLTWRANSIFSHETTNRKKEQWGNKENPWAPTLRRAVSNPTLFLVVLYVSVVLVFGTWRKQPLLLFLLPLRVIRIGERTSCGKAHLLSQESCSPSLPMVFCRFISPKLFSFFLESQDLLIFAS